jgi:hypothetical protein
VKPLPCHYERIKAAKPVLMGEGGGGRRRAGVASSLVFTVQGWTVDTFRSETRLGPTEEAETRPNQFALP